MGTCLNLLDSASSSLYSHISAHCVAYYKYTQLLFLSSKQDKGLFISWHFHKKNSFVVVELDVSEFTPTLKQMEHLFPWLLATGSVHMPSRAILLSDFPRAARRPPIQLYCPHLSSACTWTPWLPGFSNTLNLSSFSFVGRWISYAEQLIENNCGTQNDHLVCMVRT